MALLAAALAGDVPRVRELLGSGDEAQRRAALSAALAAGEAGAALSLVHEGCVGMPASDAGVAADAVGAAVDAAMFRGARAGEVASSTLFAASGCEEAEAVPAGLGAVALASAGARVVFAAGSGGGVWAWDAGGALPPARLPMPPWAERAPVRAVSAGAAHVLVLLADGALVTLGANERSQCGAPACASMPPRCVKTGSLRGAPQLVAVAAGGAHSVAVDAAGGVHVVGCNDALQLGEATTVAQPAAARPAFARLGAFGVEGAAGAAVAAAASARHTLVVCGDGQCWQLGHFQAPIRLAFDVGRGSTGVGGRPDADAAGDSGGGNGGGEEVGWARVAGERARVVRAAAGVHHSLALDDAGRVWSWAAPTLIWGTTSARAAEPLLGVSRCGRLARGGGGVHAGSVGGAHCGARTIAAGHAAAGVSGTAPAVVPRLPRGASVAVVEWRNAVTTVGGDVYVWGTDPTTAPHPYDSDTCVCARWIAFWGYLSTAARGHHGRSAAAVSGVPRRVTGVAQAVDAACCGSSTLVAVRLWLADAVASPCADGGLPSLKRLCEGRLARDVHLGNVGSLLRLAVTHEAPALAAAVGAFVSRNLRAVLACVRGREAALLLTHAAGLRHGTCVAALPRASGRRPWRTTRGGRGVGRAPRRWVPEPPGSAARAGADADAGDGARIV